MITAYTYVYHDPERNHPIYVGKGSGHRAYVHLKGAKNKRLDRRIVILRESGLEPRIEIFHHESDAAALKHEVELIAKFGRADLGLGTLYNLTDGGDGPKNPGPEARRKMSEAVKGNKRRLGKHHSSETKERLRFTSSQHKHTKESLKLMSEKHTGENNARALEWEITHPDGTIELVIALGHWIKSKPDLSKSMMYRSAKLNVPYKGFTVRKLS